MPAWHVDFTCHMCKCTLEFQFISSVVKLTTKKSHHATLIAECVRAETRQNPMSMGRVKARVAENVA